jgi:UPF0755 protein
MQIEHHRPRRRGSALRLAIRFAAFLILVALLASGGLWLAVKLNSGGFQTDFGPPGENLSALERAGLWAYLFVNAEKLSTPAGSDPAPAAFVVNSGENAGIVADRLAQAGLVRDAELLRMYMRYRGLDDQIEAGNFTLNATMPIPALAEALTQARPDEIRIRVWEGWRLEQIADNLIEQPHLKTSREEFLRLVEPGGLRPANFTFLADLPPTASLEGFMFPDSYRFLPQATTTDLITRFLLEFDTQVTPQMRADAVARGLTLYQVVTLASIVEREAVHDEERPLIAGVFLNRLSAGMRLDADPTVQYAIATAADWWPPLEIDPRTVDDPYNTYAHEGLPPGPIANPGLSSIRAVIYPADTDYLFFRAKCNDSKYHNFSTTYEQHLAFACP